MSLNRFGHLLTMTTWGESHGPAIGAVVDGCPPGLQLDEQWIEQWIAKAPSRHLGPSVGAEGAGPGTHPVGDL
jgi:chorismate synthase